MLWVALAGHNVKWIEIHFLMERCENYLQVEIINVFSLIQHNYHVCIE